MSFGLFSIKQPYGMGSQIVGSKGVDKRMDVIATAVRAKMTASAKDPVNMAGYVASNILDGMLKPFYMEDLGKVGKNDILLDVRTKGEFQSGHLPGAVNIPVHELRKHLDELDREKRIYIYCGIGLRGYIAQRILEQKGYDTLNMSGGYSLWNAADIDRRAQGAAFEQCSHCGKAV